MGKLRLRERTKGMQQCRAARNPSSSIGPHVISFHSLNNLTKEGWWDLFHSRGNRGIERLSTLPKVSVLCL